MKRLTREEYLAEATTAYNKMINDLGMEFLTIGTNYSENTEGWTLRDMVSEAQYQLDVCYEEDNANADGRSIRDLIDRYSVDEDDARRWHADWLAKTRRLRRFINKYKAEALKNTCKTGHCSKFD